MRNAAEHTFLTGIGGKAKGLLLLQEMGCRVPAFYVLTTARLTAAEDTPAMQLLLEEIFTALPGAELFAVRSSALEEDGTRYSFAGQFETLLYVKKENLAEAIKKVWQSASSERVKTYQAFHKLETAPSIAIVVQQMIPAEVSGVAFGVHPVSGDPDIKVINAVFGVGEGLVSGELNADEYLVSSERIQYNTVRKEQRFVQSLHDGAGTRVEAVPDELMNEATLSEIELKELCATLDKLHHKNGLHYDMEFAVYQGKIFYLQARPVTTAVKSRDQYIVWDNSNIIESYPGLSSPLTFSFITKMYEAVYRQFSLLMGVDKRAVEESKDIYANMLGLLHGRVYYNLLSWYRALAKLPGYKVNAAFMEKMMGVKERFELNEPPTQGKGLVAYLNLTRSIFGILKNHNSVDRQRKEFLAHVNAVLADYYRIDWDSLSEAVIVRKYVEFEHTLVTKWKAPLVNDFFAMIYFGLLQKLVGKYTGGKEPHLHNDLVSGAGDIVSTQPVLQGLTLADQIAALPELEAIFTSGEEICPRLPQFPAFETAFNAYINQWGDRCVEELKLETTSYRQEPERFARILAGYLSADRERLRLAFEQAHHTRLKAEEKIAGYLKGKPFKRWLFGYVLKKARYLVSNRENLRFERTRGFGMVRIMFLALGKKLEAQRLLETHRDIFFLTQNEVFDFIKGTAVDTDLKALVKHRKAAYEGYKKINLPERIRTFGMVYPDIIAEADAEQTGSSSTLKGIGCSAGKVRAKATVLKAANETGNLQGTILVTASTDPGWVSLFPTCSGILVERGSLLSHSAIVSREMGIPCVVGISGLLSSLKTGDEVEMDGVTGEIKVLSHG